MCWDSFIWVLEIITHPPCKSPMYTLQSPGKSNAKNQAQFNYAKETSNYPVQCTGTPKNTKLQNFMGYRQPRQAITKKTIFSPLLLTSHHPLSSSLLLLSHIPFTSPSTGPCTLPTPQPSPSMSDCYLIETTPESQAP